MDLTTQILAECSLTADSLPRCRVDGRSAVNELEPHLRWACCRSTARVCVCLKVWEVLGVTVRLGNSEDGGNTG